MMGFHGSTRDVLFLVCSSGALDGYIDGGVYAPNPSTCAVAQTQDHRTGAAMPLSVARSALQPVLGAVAQSGGPSQADGPTHDPPPRARTPSSAGVSKRQNQRQIARKVTLGVVDRRGRTRQIMSLLCRSSRSCHRTDRCLRTRARPEEGSWSAETRASIVIMTTVRCPARSVHSG